MFLKKLETVICFQKHCFWMMLKLSFYDRSSQYWQLRWWKGDLRSNQTWPMTMVVLGWKPIPAQQWQVIHLPDCIDNFYTSGELFWGENRRKECELRIKILCKVEHLKMMQEKLSKLTFFLWKHCCNAAIGHIGFLSSFLMDLQKNEKKRSMFEWVTVCFLGKKQWQKM